MVDNYAINYPVNKKYLYYNFFINKIFLINLIVLIAFGTFSSFYKYIILFILNLIILIATIKNIKVKKSTKFLEGVFPLILLYLFHAIISAFLGLDALNSLSTVAKYAIFFWVLYTIFIWLQNKKNIYLLLRSILISSIVIDLTLLFNFFMNGFALTQRIGGIVSNVNNAGYILVFGIISAILLKNWSRKNIYTIPILLNLFGLLLTGSRSAMLFLATFILMYILQSKRFKLKHIILSIVLFLVSIIVVIGNSGYILSNLLRVNSGTAGRNYFWEASFYIWEDFKWFGIGFGNFSDISSKYLALTSADSWTISILGELHSSHAMILDSLIQLGAIGFILLLFIIFRVLQVIRKKAPNLNTANIYIPKTAMIAITIGVLIRSFFEPFGFLNYAYISTDLLFWSLFIAYQVQSVEKES